MSLPKMDIIECDGLIVAATVEANVDHRYPIYYPASCLIHVVAGELKLDIEGQHYPIREGEIALVRKYTQGTYFKSEGRQGQRFREHIFLLYDEFIEEVIRDFELTGEYMPLGVPMITFTNEPILQGLMQSIETYITGQARIDRALIRLKTKEALLALTRLRPELIHVFHEISAPAKADLFEFMNHHYTQNLSLAQFAKLSGRSLSGFNREFRDIFRMTPSKWLKQQRLELAMQLLQQTNKTAIHIYQEVGFEDLGHFSRSFKGHFGKNPSEVK